MAYRIWNIADKKYLLWWGKGELLGFYKVGVEPGYLNGVIVPKPEGIDYKVLAYTTGECATVDGDYASEQGRKKLKEKLSQQPDVGIEITSKNGKKHYITGSEIKEIGPNDKPQYKPTNFKVVEKVDGDIDIDATFKEGCAGCSAAAKEAFNQALADAKARNGGKVKLDDLLIKDQDPLFPLAGGGLKYKSADLGDFLAGISKAYNSVLEYSKVPTDVWEPNKDFIVRDNGGYIAGAVDGVRDELLDKADLVGLVLTTVSNPTETKKQLGKFGRDFDWEKAKTLAQGVVNYDAEEFGKGGSYQGHATGKVGASVLVTVTTGGLLAIVTQVPEKLDNLATKLLKLLEKLKTKLSNPSDIALISKLEKDLAKTDFFDALDADNDLVKSWEVLENANRPDLKVKVPTLQSMAKLLKNPKAIAIFGSEAQLMDALKNFSITHASKDWSWNKSGLDFHLNLLNKHIDEFQGIDGFDKSIKDAITNTNQHVQDGFWHSMKATDDLGLKRAEVSKFDMEFEAEGLACERCKFDLQLNAVPPALRLIEFKSYADPSQIPLPQFLNYMGSINNLSEMKYIFNVAKLAASGKNAKEGMKAFLKAKEIEIISSMNASEKTELGLAADATELTNTQIQKIVDIVVE